MNWPSWLSSVIVNLLFAGGPAGAGFVGADSKVSAVNFCRFVVIACAVSEMNTHRFPGARRVSTLQGIQRQNRALPLNVRERCARFFSHRRTEAYGFWRAAPQLEPPRIWMSMAVACAAAACLPPGS